LGLVLQPNSLKLRSCKFNIIINIINITFGPGVAVKLKILEYNFKKNLTFLDFSFFLFYLCKKIKIIPQYRVNNVTSSYLKLNHKSAKPIFQN